jgi:capsular exopolysaccharide synthesis family protein
MSALHLANSRPVYTASASLLVLQQGGRPFNLLNNNVASVTDLVASLDGYSNYLPTHCRIIRSPLIVDAALASAGRKDLSARSVMARLSVRVPEDSGKTIELSYTADTAAEAAEVLGAVIASYNQFLKSNYQKNSTEVLALIENVSVKLSKELKDLERDYLEFRRKNPAYTADENGRSFVARRLDQWDQLANQAMIRAFQLRSQWELGGKLAREGKDVTAFADAVGQLGPEAKGATPQGDAGGAPRGLEEELSTAQFRRLATERLLAALRAQQAVTAGRDVNEEELAEAFHAEPAVAALDAELERARGRLYSARRVARSSGDAAVLNAARQVRAVEERLASRWAQRKPALLARKDDEPEPVRRAESELLALKAQEAVLLERKEQVRLDQLRALRREREQLAARQGNDHADVRQIDERIAGLADDGSAGGAPKAGPARAWLDSIAQGLESVEELRARIQHRFDEDLKAVKDVEVVKVQESNMRHNLERQRALFDTVVDQLKQARLMSDYGSVTAQTLDPPNVAVSKPNAVRDLLIALVIGLGAGAAVVMLADQLDARLRTLSDLRSVLNYAVLASIPQWDTRRKGAVASVGMVSHANPRSALSEAYKSLRTNLVGFHRDRRAQLILVTSPESGEGKSTTASNLAITLAHSGARVLLVDADLRRPSLDRWYDLDRDRGLVDVLRVQSPLSSVVQPTVVENLDFLAAGPEPENPAELLASSVLAELLDEARRSYDFVILDSSPMLAVTDPAIIAERVDGVLLVVRASYSRRRSTERTVELLKALGTPVLGTVVNGVTRELLGFDYYGYGYSYGYGAANGQGGHRPPGLASWRRIPLLSRRFIGREPGHEAERPELGTSATAEAADDVA